MTIQSDVQSLTPDTPVELYQLSGYNPANANETFYFTKIIGARFQAVSYYTIPVEGSGFDLDGQGALPRPKLKIWDNSRLLTAIIDQYGGIEGAILNRVVSTRKYLDDMPTANSSQLLTQCSYTVSQMTYRGWQKSGEDELVYVIEYELSTPLDFVDEELPRRPCLRNTCVWVYRGQECGYTGGPVAAEDDSPTIYQNLDVCGHRLSSCKLRFGQYAVLPFGGYPGLAGW